MSKLVSRSGQLASSACAETWRDEKVGGSMRRAEGAPWCLEAPSAGSPRGDGARTFSGRSDGAEPEGLATRG